MARLVARHRAALARGDDGMALITVMLAAVVMLLLATAAVAYGTGSQNLSRRDQDWNASLAAAEAGVDDYLFRLAENDTYYLYSATNPPPTANGAFTGFVPVPGPANGSTFRYTPDISKLSVDGTIRLTSTGRVRGVERTVDVTLRRRNFLDYLYYTKYETLDPDLYNGNPYDTDEAENYCAKYYYEGRNSNCVNITFFSRDVVNGPLHTNDALLICGTPQFKGATSTSWSGSGGKRWRDGCPTSSPFFANPGDPKLLAPLEMPPSNSAIKSETGPGTQGCRYSGPTSITLHGNGQMTVDSKWTTAGTVGPASCPINGGGGAPGTGPLPANGVIYVQNVTSGGPNCPYTVNGRRHPLGYPISNDITRYGCRDGDAFVEGTLNGQLTVAAENDVVITDDLTYQGGLTGTDLLGLVANNNVEVYHPVRCSSGSSSSCNLDVDPGQSGKQTLEDLQIHAAILSVKHSFVVQNYNIGDADEMGDLKVRGAIAQKYRGPVGTFSGNNPVTGYEKDYVYDNRLKYLSPPKFLDPVQSAWGVATWAEAKSP